MPASDLLQLIRAEELLMESTLRLLTAWQVTGVANCKLAVRLVSPASQMARRHTEYSVSPCKEVSSAGDAVG